MRVQSSPRVWQSDGASDHSLDMGILTNCHESRGTFGRKTPFEVRGGGGGGGLGKGRPTPPLLNQPCQKPKLPGFSDRAYRYTPISIAVLSRPLGTGTVNTDQTITCSAVPPHCFGISVQNPYVSQYGSHLHRNALPPFMSQHFFGKFWWWGHQHAPQTHLCLCPAGAPCCRAYSPRDSLARLPLNTSRKRRRSLP